MMPHVDGSKWVRGVEDRQLSRRHISGACFVDLCRAFDFNFHVGTLLQYVLYLHTFRMTAIEQA